MKTAATYKQSYLVRPVVPFPNAISRRQFLHKLLDKALLAVSGVGIVVTVVFLLMMN